MIPDGQPGYYVIVATQREPRPTVYMTCPTCRQSVSSPDMADGRCSGCGEVLE